MPIIRTYNLQEAGATRSNDALPPSTLEILRVTSLPSMPSCSSIQEQSKMGNQHLGGSRTQIITSLTSNSSLHSDGRVITERLSSIVDKLHDRITGSNLVNPKRCGLLSSILSTINQSSQQTGILSIDDTAKLSYQFEKLAKTLPKGNIKDIFSLLGQNMKSGWIMQKNQELNEEKKQQLAPLASPGTSENHSISVGISTGISMLPVSAGPGSVGPYAGLSVGVQKARSLSADDETSFFVNSITNCKVSVDAGAQVKLTDQIGAKLGANAQFNHTKVKFKAYNSVQQYVDKKGHKLNWANRSEYVNISKKNKVTHFIKSHLLFKLGSELKKLKHERQQAANSQHRLNHLLETVLDIKTTVTATAPDRSKPAFGHYNTWAGEVKLEANAGATVNVGEVGLKLAAGAAVSYQESVTNIYGFMPSQFFNIIKNNADKLAELPANLIRHAKEIADYSSNSNSATKCLKLLSQDIDSYYKIVQQYDDVKSGKNPTQDELKLHRIAKHTIEDRWGAIGRHQFLQFANASHAYLAHKAMTVVSGEKVLTSEQQACKMDLIENVAIKIKFPPIEYSKTRLDKIATFMQQTYLKITDSKTAIHISTGPFSAQLDILKRERIHPSRVRAGSYVDLTLTWTISGSLQGALDKVSITAKINEAAEKEGITLPQEFDFSPDLSGEKSGSVLIRFFKPNYAKDADFKGDIGYRWQFIRHINSVSAGGKIGASAMVAPGVSVGGNIGVNYSKSTMSSEKIGIEDLTYSMVRYNRFFENSEQNPANNEWQEFERKNEIEYKKMFRHLGEQTHKIHKEAQHFLRELIARAPDEPNKAKAESLLHDFNQAMSNYSVDPTSIDKFNIAKVYFNEYLEKQTLPWREELMSYTTDLPFVQTANSGLSLGTKIKKSLNLHERVEA
ncbi:hypothetical protein KFE26_22745 [Shewanella sp. M16]|uniref:hypothetical protein n=1 Tax=Shewanella sp. M16 TaxID=2830837 RepID=UPI001BAEF342|nr:hypothetical protein [Shewanella sp. M16]MBS0045071.1 hypothetical protein [Shewanella sp. M16]